MRMLWDRNAMSAQTGSPEHPQGFFRKGRLRNGAESSLRLRAVKPIEAVRGYKAVFANLLAVMIWHIFLVVRRKPKKSFDRTMRTGGSC